MINLHSFIRELSERMECFLWYNGLVNRETNSVINGRVELRRSGDILVATNGVDRFIPRQLPFEHNGFGQDNEWVAANFTNANVIRFRVRRRNQVGYLNKNVVYCHSYFWGLFFIIL